MDKKQKNLFRKDIQPPKAAMEKPLPAENPANYDWRFTKETCISLTEKIKGNNSKIALFGTPALYLELLKNKENVHLFDVNSLLINYLPKKTNVHIVDLNTHTFIEESDFDCVFMDPPWYVDHYQKWTSQANIITKAGGRIYVSLFQELLRPKAIKQRNKILSNFNLIGNVDIKKNFLNYITPQFEQEVFDYYNIPIYKNWRVADLIEIRNETELPKTKNPSIKDHWLRFEINNITISLYIVKNNSNEKIDVKSPYKNGDSLIKTISARNNAKKNANLITSRNQGYLVNGSKKLAIVLREIERGSTLKDVHEKCNLDLVEVRKVSNLLKDILT